ncbi:MAG: PAS domain-containing protein [Alphaproteobacteria bacterium]|nr:PAS domain-containing protein [Alphaproteobacteria bacterium]
MQRTRKTTDAGIGDSEAQQRQALRTARIGTFIWDDNAEACLYCSEELADLLGMSVADFMANRGTTSSFLQFVHYEDRETFSRAMYRAVIEATPYDLEYRCHDVHGRLVHLRDIGEPVHGANGRQIGTFGTIQDITGIRRAEQELRQREELLRTVADNIPACVAFLDKDLRYRFVNRLAEQWYSRPAAEIVGRHARDVIGDETFERMRPRAEAALAGQYVRFEADERQFPDGSERSVDVSYAPHFNERGEIEGLLALILDITERKRAQQALRRNMESADLLRHIATAASEAVSAEDAMALCLKAFCTFGGWEIGGAFVRADDGSDDMAPAGLWSAEDPDSFTTVRPIAEEGRFAPGEGLPGRIAASGKPEWITGDPASADDRTSRDDVAGGGFGFPVLVDGEVAAVLGFFSRAARDPELDLFDVSAQAGAILGRVIERQRADRALSEREQQIRLITDNLPVLIAYVGRDWRFQFVNKTTAMWYGRPASELVGHDLTEFFRPGILDRVRPHIEAALRGEFVHFEDVLEYADGKQRNIEGTYVPHFDDGGAVRGFFSLVADVTDRIQREEELRHAQKMEALGKLTGGIAHEFNNQLAVIIGNLELLRDRPEDFDAAVEAVGRAAVRGSELTHRLLSFSRQQPLRPDVVDLPELVDELAMTLARMLGETVKVEMTAGKRAWPARVDRGQLENAILNLAVNAQHAMPRGGTLTLETRNTKIRRADAARHKNARAGDYVVLSVADNGHGMPPAVLEHAFEPFFTTKAVGEGSGLGLSMVYGFASQSGGFAEIESRPDEGTTVRIYLPRAVGQRQRTSVRPQEETLVQAGGTILVVEDDPDVRRLTVTLLSSLGYSVLEAQDAEHALPLLAGDDAIDMLLSDVVLPGDQSGPVIAETARRLRPDLKVLFMSGYAADVLGRDREAGPHTVSADLLSKPFTRAELARKVSTTLKSTLSGVC